MTAELARPKWMSNGCKICSHFGYKFYFVTVCLLYREILNYYILAPLVRVANAFFDVWEPLTYMYMCVKYMYVMYMYVSWYMCIMYMYIYTDKIRYKV